MRKRRITAFTLIEILLVLIIIGLLIGVLFQTYRTIAMISVRVRHEKSIGSTVTQMQTIVQNIMDTHTIDYDAIEQDQNSGMPSAGNAGSSSAGNTRTSSARRTRLPLRTASGEKISLILENNMLFLQKTSPTASASEEGERIPLWENSVLFRYATFILAPETNPATEQIFTHISQPGVWLIGTMGVAQDEHISFPLQTYFTLLQK